MSSREGTTKPDANLFFRSTGARIELSVANVVALSDHSRTLLQAQAADTHQLREEVRDLRQLVGLGSRGVSFGRPPSYFLQPNVLPLHTGDSNKGADVVLEGRRGLEVQVVWRPSWACDTSCHCLCHEATHGRSPELLDRFLGILFWGYCGLPIARKRCDVAACRRRRGSKFAMSYYFPAWFVEKKSSLHYAPCRLVDPKFQSRWSALFRMALYYSSTHITKTWLGSNHYSRKAWLPHPMQAIWMAVRHFTYASASQMLTKH